jgi:phospholipase D1/2
VGPEGGPDTQVDVTLAVIKPDAGVEGLILEEKTTVRTETIRLPATEEEAREEVARFEEGAAGVRGDADVADTVGQHALADRTRLGDEHWLGTASEERDACVPCSAFFFPRVCGPLSRVFTADTSRSCCTSTRS